MNDKHHPFKPSDGGNNDENVSDAAEPNTNDELTDDRLTDEFETASIASTVADRPSVDKDIFF